MIWISNRYGLDANFGKTKRLHGKCERSEIRKQRGSLRQRAIYCSIAAGTPLAFSVSRSSRHDRQVDLPVRRSARDAGQEATLNFESFAII